MIIRWVFGNKRQSGQYPSRRSPFQVVIGPETVVIAPDFLGELNILSADLGNNTVNVVTTITVLSLTLRMGMFGEKRFGDRGIWGSAVSYYYRTDSKNVKGLNTALNVVKV